MYLEEVASQVLVNAGKFSSKQEALAAFKAEFNLHFPQRNYEKWNKQIPDQMVNNIIVNVGKNSSISIRFLIKDLETISNVL
jgi:hypothetical protein